MTYNGDQLVSLIAQNHNANLELVQVFGGKSNLLELSYGDYVYHWIFHSLHKVP